MKICIDCKELKPLDQFTKYQKSSDGLGSICKCCGPKRMRAYHLKTKYNISVDQYETMCKAQDYKCAVCKKPTISGRRLAVDHCHQTGVLRGLLCPSCNSGIGKLGDSVDLLEAAIHYLKQFIPK